MRTALLALLVVSCATLGAQDFSSYERVLVRTYPVGTGLGEFRVFEESGWSTGPEAIAFDALGLMYVCDTSQQRVALADRSFEVREEHKGEIGFGLTSAMVVEEGLDLYDYLAGVTRIDHTGAKLFEMGFEETTYDNRVVPGGYYYYGHVLFAYLRDGAIVSVVGPGPDWRQNTGRILGTSQTRALFAESDKYGLNGLVLDDWGRLFQGAKNETRSFDVYLRWVRQVNSGEIRKRGNAAHLLRDPMRSAGTATFHGGDANANVYWRAGDSVLIFDRDGAVIDMLLSSGGVAIRSVHPSGDLYGLHTTAIDGPRLYRIANVWDPKARELWEAEVIAATGEGIRSAEVTAGPLRVRRAAGPMGAIAGELSKGETVEVLWHGSQKAQIDGFDDYWYEVRRTSDGLQGWVYGGYLRIQ